MKIEGVVVKELAVHQDIPDADENVAKSGFLMEVLRDDDNLHFYSGLQGYHQSFSLAQKTGRLMVCGVRQGIYCSSRFKARILHMRYH